MPYIKRTMTEKEIFIEKMKKKDQEILCGYNFIL